MAIEKFRKTGLVYFLMFKNLIPVVLRGNGDYRNGMCTIGCAKALVNLIYEFKFAPEKFYFKDGKLYYDKNEILQDSYALAHLSACGFIKNRDIFYYSKFNVKFKEATWNMFEIFA